MDVYGIWCVPKFYPWDVGWTIHRSAFFSRFALQRFRLTVRRMAMKLRNFMGMDRMDHLLTQLTHFDPIFVMKSDACNQVFREIGQIGKLMETIYLLSSTCFRPKLSGTIIGSSSYDGTVRLWSVTGKCLKVLEGRSRPYWTSNDGLGHDLNFGDICVHICTYTYIYTHTTYLMRHIKRYLGDITNIGIMWDI